MGGICEIRLAPYRHGFYTSVTHFYVSPLTYVTVLNYTALLFRLLSVDTCYLVSVWLFITIKPWCHQLTILLSLSCVLRHGILTLLLFNHDVSIFWLRCFAVFILCLGNDYASSDRWRCLGLRTNTPFCLSLLSLVSFSLAAVTLCLRIDVV